MKLLKAITQVFGAVASTVETVADTVDLGASLAKEAIIDEGIKRDLQSAKEIMELKDELTIDATDLASINELRSLRAKGQQYEPTIAEAE